MRVGGIVRSGQLVLGTALTLAIASGCGSGDDSGPAPGRATPEKEPPADVSPPAPDAKLAPPAPAPAEVDVGAIVAAGDAAQGEALYQSYCASCHGARGAGDGPLAATLQPPPARHDDGSYMNPLGDDHLFKVIDLGGAAIGKSPLMAPWGGTLSDEQIGHVIAFIRTLADPPYGP